MLAVVSVPVKLAALEIVWPLIAPEVIAPEPRLSEEPLAAPMLGVVRVGLACITKVLPVPVCEATAVALPTEVIGPVRLALVVTVAALPEILPVIVEENT